MAAIVEKKARAVNPWFVHVNEYRGANPGTKYKDALKAAGASYTKKVAVEKRTNGERKVNPWMVHIDEWKAAHTGWKETMSYKDVLKVCKETYGVKAEASSEVSEPV